MVFVTAPFAQWSGVEGRPLVLAGPAVAESATQLSETARRLRGARVDFLAATVWPPPEAAEGSAETDARGLAWLLEAGRAHQLRTATEVATPAQAEQALAAGVDLLCVAGETTASAPATKAMAHALRGVAQPVLVANPPHPEIEPWLEALERLAAAGVRALGAVHAGFPAVGAAGTREALGWEVVIELRRRLPELPVVAEVGRLAGARDRVVAVAQSALDLGLQGLWLDAHPDPDHAWRGAGHQITPERAAGVLSELVVRLPASDEAGFHDALETLRREIDRLDRGLLDLLAERMGVVDRIAGAKRERNVASLQVERWRAMVEERLRWAAALGLEPELARTVFAAVHGESVRRQSAQLRRPPEAADDPPADPT